MTPEQDAEVSTALLAYWTARDEARLAQEGRGSKDVGGRADVTKGGHLDRIAQLLGRTCIEAGAPVHEVYYKAPKDDPNRRANISNMLTLPGYFRPTKNWDLVVYHDREPVIAIELKSQNGPSYGNNANNRAEEAIGNAVDLSKACKAGLLRRPWTGYVFVIEDDEMSRRTESGRGKIGTQRPDPIFTGWSYVRRVELLCNRLVEAKHYDSAWAVATSRPACPAGPDADLEKQREKCAQFAVNKKVIPEPHEHNFAWNEPASEVGYVQFIDALAAEVKKYDWSRPAGEQRPHR
ncbi:PaeR7I family type II restriction endonuclease [Lentzea sp. NPDC058450]|uniref:PaeR7I family type II restriction endonuclease n=1 Tax=Lentzea sp. NPDC058450 TaxID=3346505 RepID=UPI003652BB19